MTQVSSTNMTRLRSFFTDGASQKGSPRLYVCCVPVCVPVCVCLCGVSLSVCLCVCDVFWRCEGVCVVHMCGGVGVCVCLVCVYALTRLLFYRGSVAKRGGFAQPDAIARYMYICI